MKNRRERFKAVIVAGGPCSGKGNAITRIKSHLSRDYLDRLVLSGQIPEKAIEPQVISMSGRLMAKRDDTVVGALVRQQMKDGEHVEQSVVSEVFAASCAGLAHGVTDLIFDGVNRTPFQAEEVSRTIRGFPYPYELVGLFIDTPVDVCLERMRRRAIEEQREDDNETSMARRLELYNTVEIPALNHLRQLGVTVYAVNGSETRDGIAALAIQALGL